MTIFGKRVYPLEPAAGPSPSAGASHAIPVPKASTPRATTTPIPTPKPVDLFEDIVFPEDLDCEGEMECDEAMTSVSECNVNLDRRQSGDSSDMHSSNWDDSKVSNVISLPATLLSYGIVMLRTMYHTLSHALHLGLLSRQRNRRRNYHQQACIFMSIQ